MICGFFSKEIALITPILVFTFWALFLKNPQLKMFSAKILWRLATLILAVGSLGYILHGAVFPHIEVMQRANELSILERLLTQCRVIWYYVILFLTPHPDLLTLEHHVVPSKSLLMPWTTILGLLGIIFSLVAGWMLRQKKPLVSFGIFWFFECLILESTVIPLELMFEHRAYLPSIGLMLIAAGLTTPSVFSGEKVEIQLRGSKP